MKTLYEELCRLVDHNNIIVETKISCTETIFGDLSWDGDEYQNLDDFIKDPAVEIKTNDFWLVLQRLKGKIRYYANIYPRWEDRDLGNTEMGELISTSDCIKFLDQLLNRLSFCEIQVERKIKAFGQADSNEVSKGGVDGERRK